MEDYKNEIEMLRQSFAQGKSDAEIQMPDAEAELAAFMAAHKEHFAHKGPRLAFIRKIAALFLGILMLTGFAYAAVRTGRKSHEKHFVRTVYHVHLTVSELFYHEHAEIIRAGPLDRGNIVYLKGACSKFRIDLEARRGIVIYH